MIATIGCAAGSCLMAGLGYWMIQANSVKPGESAFVSAFSPRWLAYYAGCLLLALGLFALCIGTPMCYIARR